MCRYPHAGLGLRGRGITDIAKDQIVRHMDRGENFLGGGEVRDYPRNFYVRVGEGMVVRRGEVGATRVKLELEGLLGE